jgi:hypothetical protein
VLVGWCSTSAGIDYRPQSPTIIRGDLRISQIVTSSVGIWCPLSICQILLRIDFDIAKCDIKDSAASRFCCNQLRPKLEVAICDFKFVTHSSTYPSRIGINVRRDVAPRGRPEYCSVHVGVAQQKRALADPFNTRLFQLAFFMPRLPLRPGPNFV